MQKGLVRAAAHAGSWYTSNKQDLLKDLNGFLQKATEPILNVSELVGSKTIRGLIGPHAGYSYCGPTGAYAYKFINPSTVKRVFVLGPSHHFYLEGCGFSDASVIETPVANLKVDVSILQQLKDNYPSLFKQVDIEDDQEEHSLEMHFPWIARTFDVNSIQVVPIIVGHLTESTAKEYGKILAPFLEKHENFFVVSSDFCHWGKRFRYTFYDDKKGDIYQSIENLDKLGMEAIESMNSQQFDTYLKKFKNTICGRNPIYLLLNSCEQASKELDCQIKFIHYSQSSRCKSMNDSSVSYASGILLSK